MRDFHSYQEAVRPGDAGRLAEAARTLAVECSERRAPPMIHGNRHGPGGGHCALGWIEARCDMRWFPFHAVGASDECVRVAAINNEEDDEHHDLRQERLVPALLALADAMEEQAMLTSGEAARVARNALRVRATARVLERA